MGYHILILVYVFSGPGNPMRLREPESVDNYKSIVSIFVMLEHRLKSEHTLGLAF